MTISLSVFLPSGRSNAAWEFAEFIWGRQWKKGGWRAHKIIAPKTCTVNAGVLGPLSPLWWVMFLHQICLGSLWPYMSEECCHRGTAKEATNMKLLTCYLDAGIQKNRRVQHELLPSRKAKCRPRAYITYVQRKTKAAILMQNVWSNPESRLLRPGKGQKLRWAGVGRSTCRSSVKALHIYKDKFDINANAIVKTKRQTNK